MVSNFDHVTILVTDLDEARRFFGLLGFVEDQAVVISGEAMDAYMGIPHLEADHVTLVIPGSEPRQELQLLRLHSPSATIDDGSGNLARTGFNHVCFRVPNLDETLATMVEAGIGPRSEPMSFHNRKLVFLDGPSDVVIELAEWI
jgi:catechol 2,3-dioxygenase-like lactoylglutathione lyase family enzyme